MPEEQLKRALRRANNPYRIFLALFLIVGGSVRIIVAINDLIDHLFPNWFLNFKTYLISKHSTTEVWIGVTVFFLLSFLLFKFKKRKPFYYGLIETIVSTYGLYTVTVDLEGEKTDILKFFAALYVCVRGMNNIDDGIRRNDWPNTFASKLWRSLKMFYSAYH